MFKSIKSLCAAALLSFAALSAAPAAAQDPVRETHGAWEVRCKGDACYMIQVGKDASGGAVLSFGIRKLSAPRTEGEVTFIAGAEFFTKTGVYLPNGVAFAIDGQQSRRIPFERCFPEGCAALPLVQQQLIDAMKAGGKVTVTIFPNPGEPITVEVSLSGFTAAYDAL